MKHTLIVTFLIGVLRAQDNSPLFTIELHDDDTEEVALQNLSPVSAELRAAAMAAAGCVEGSAFGVRRWGNQLSFTCRHPVDRSGLTIAAQWGFSPLVAALKAPRLTTCFYHPDWPYSENDQNLPMQRISKRIAYCGAWTVSGAGPLQVRVKAGYEAGSARRVGWAALVFVLVFGAAGVLLPGKDFLQRHTLTTLFAAACFGWMAVILALDGLRILSLWFGFAGHGRWFWAGLAASTPVLALAAAFSFRRQASVSKAVRRLALFALAGFVLTTAVLCGGPQADSLTILGYGLGAVAFAIAVRTSGAQSRLVRVEQGELAASMERLALKARVQVPKLMLWLAPAGSASGAMAVLGRRRLILISTSLLKLCSRRETDAIVAHELAHFVQRRRVMVFFTACALTAIVMSAAVVEQRLQAWAVLAVILCILVNSAWKRRLEFAADEFSARLTGDPESMGAALLKLSTANQTPFCGSALREMLLSHPWTEKRLRRLAVRRDVAESSCGDAGYDAGPAERAVNRPLPLLLHGLSQYMKFLQAASWVAAFAAGACAWLLPAWPGVVFLAASAIGFFATSALWSRRLRSLVPDVRASLLSLHGAAWAEAPLFGMSPGVGHTVFDSAYDWDVGLARITSSALCYAGDRAAFSLPRAAIHRVELRDGPSIRWVRAKVVCIHLNSGTPESIALTPGPGRTDSERFFDALQKWLEGAGGGETADCALPALDSCKLAERTARRKKAVERSGFLSLCGAHGGSGLHWLLGDSGLELDSGDDVTAGGRAGVDYSVPAAGRGCSSGEIDREELIPTVIQARPW